MSAQVDNGRKICHIHEEMWSRLRRSTQHSCRSKESEWWYNYEAIQALRQQLIGNNCWGATLRDRDFDTQLKLSLVTQLRQVTLSKDYSEQFALTLLGAFLRLVTGEDQSVHNHEVSGIDYIGDRILTFVAQAEFEESSPDQFIIDRTVNLLQGQTSFG